MIYIKSNEILKGLMLHKYPLAMIDVLFDVMFIIESWGVTSVLTSAYREGDTGVHGSCRGIDVRSYRLEWEQIEELLSVLNSKWVYDPTRPNKKVLIYHDVGRGPHLHLQVHPNTRLREGGKCHS